MSDIKHHHDGQGLNELCTIIADERDPNAGGASHTYEFHVEGVELESRLQFQHGPRGVEGSKLGITDAAVVAALIDRYRAFQAGPFPSSHGAKTLHHLEQALESMHERTRERAARGVLGTNKA